MTSKKKKATKKKNNSKQNPFIEFISSYQFLYSSLAILFIIVVILGIMVFNKGREYRNNHANMVFPILEEKVHNSMNIDLNELKKKKRYLIKVTNYRGSKVNQNELSYSLTIHNDTNVSIEMVKGNDTKNLITDQKSSIIEGISLKSKEKQEDVFYIRIIDDSKLKKKDKITIEIDSKKG